mgnify:CR=1 FL=1
MMNFEYFTPTKVVFGKGTVDKVGELVKAQGGTKVLIHYGGGSVKRTGLLDRVKAALDAAGIAHVELGGVVPNPRISLVREGLELCRKEGVDFLLPVGGGSVIDSAKAIGYGLANGGDPWDFYDFKRTPTACAPVGVIVTIAAAGSEMSNSSVITNEDGWLKRGCNTDYSRPRFAIMDPELTMTLPDYQTACGCADVLMHTMERYFNFDVMDLTDALAEGLMRTVIDAAKVLVKDPKNYEARANVLWASSLSHNGLTGCGAGNGDWACHRLEHEVGGMFDVAHGAGLAAIWGSWARYVLPQNPARFAKFAVNVLGVAPQGGDTATALKGIEAMEDFYRAIKMPTNLRELGVEPTEEQILELAEKCDIATRGNLGAVKHLSREDMANIYRMAR